MVKRRLPAFMLLFLLTLLPLPCAADETVVEGSSGDTQFVRGLISRVYADKMQISVKPAKGKRVRITLLPETVMEGASQIGDLKKEQQVKVWYTVQNGEKQAERIKKMLDLGC